MAIAEMAAVAFIEDHDNLLVAQRLQMFVVIIFGDGTIQFLDGGDDDLRVAAQPFDQFIGVVRTINCSGSNASYSDCVCLSRSWRSTTNMTLSIPSISETSCAALNEVKVFPAPVACQI